MPHAKKICIVCEKNIINSRGKEIKRCTICNNTICDDHYHNCRLCSKLICENELRKCDYCPFDQCKTCTVKYKKNKSQSFSLYCLECVNSQSKTNKF